MRRVVVGVDTGGRSAVVHDGAVPAVYRITEPRAHAATPTVDDRPAADGEIVMGAVWATGAVPEASADDPIDPAAESTVECPPGAMRWHIVEFGPRRETPLHRTNTLDCNVVLRGEVELVLESGTVLLRTGDALVLPGAVHGWRTGDHPATMSVLQTGLRTEPLD